MSATALAAEPATASIGLYAVPAGWAVSPIGHLFEIQQGKALSPQARTASARYPFLRTANVLWGRLDLSVVDKMGLSIDERSRLALEPGDLLVCEGGEIGRAAVWNGELPECYYQNHIHRLRPRDGSTLPEFYMYWLQLAFTLLQLYEGVGTKTTIPNLSRGRLAALQAPVPPLDEQRRIARTLAAIQQDIEATDQFGHAGETLLRAARTRIFENGLPLSRTNQQQITAVGVFPSHWQLVPFRDYVYFQEGPGLRNWQYRPSGIPFLNIRCLVAGRLDKSTMQYLDTNEVSSKYQHFLLDAGDLVVSSSGTLGRVAVVRPEDLPCMLNTSVIRMRPSRDDLLIDYLRHFLQSESYQVQIRSWATGSAQANYGPSHLKRMTLALPPIAEQRRIAMFLDAIESAVRANEEVHRALNITFSSALARLLAVTE